MYNPNMVPFKKCKYRRSLTPGTDFDSIYVYSPEEEAALGPEWVDTPALLAAPAAPKGGDPLPAVVVDARRDAEERAGDGEFGNPVSDPWAADPVRRRRKRGGA